MQKTFASELPNPNSPEAHDNVVILFYNTTANNTSVLE
jgi:hypothetical protein